jgi:dihydroorotase
VSDVQVPGNLVVSGRRLVTPDGIRPGRLLIADGRIRDITGPGDDDRDRAGDLRNGDRGPLIDAGDTYVLPGLIDSHVHFRTPGLTGKEDWAHASRAAVCGGVTTVLDMPNTVPPALTEQAIRDKAAAVAGQSLVDYGFHLGVDPDAPGLLATLDPAIARSAKIFMAGHHTAPVVLRDPGQLDQAFAAAAAGGVQLVLHAEDDNVLTLLDGWWTGSPSDADYADRRPRTGAIVALARIIELVRRHGTRAHILHLSSREEADLACAAQAAGLPVTFELTGHHLSFTDQDTARLGGARLRLAPAIRSLADQDRLWAAVRDGQVTTIGSDHAPHTIAEKATARPPGLPGVQELAVAVWTGMRRRWPGEDPDIAIGRLARYLSSGPAELFGLAGKGFLGPGADADLAFFAPGRRWRFTEADVRSKCGWSAYAGRTMTGRVTRTIRAGRVVWDAGTGVFGEPDGRWITPAVAARSPAAQYRR